MIYQLGLLRGGGGAGKLAGFNKDDGMEESISRAAPRKVLPLVINSGPLVIKLSGNKEKTASKESEGDTGREEQCDAVVGLPVKRAEPPLPHLLAHCDMCRRLPICSISSKRIHP